MKRKTYKKMKDLGWDNFIEYVTVNNLQPKDLLKEEKVIQIQTHITMIEMAKKLEEQLYNINWEA